MANSNLNRRRVVSALVAMPCFLGCTPKHFFSAAEEDEIFDAYPFSLGIASGVPTHSSIVLWTRIAPNPLIAMGGVIKETINVHWAVYSDSNMTNILLFGTELANRTNAYSVHIQLDNLPPGTQLWYRFFSGGVASRVGRTRTLPSAESSDECRFAVVSCQNYTHGYYSAYDGIVADDPNFVLHLGDYIYEKPYGGQVRSFNLHNPPQNLNEYRLHHAIHKLDKSLANAHANLPFFLTLDNHDAVEDGVDYDPNIRTAAYKAWYEHMPVRKDFLSQKLPGAKISQRIKFGNLATINVLDGRQFRSRQNICENSADPQIGFGNYRVSCSERLNERRTMLGQQQATEVLDSLSRSKSCWNVLASPVPFGGYKFIDGRDERFYIGSWDGYPSSRNQIIDQLGSSKIDNFIVVSGDVHSNWIMDLRKDNSDVDTTFGTEIIGTSVSSDWPSILAQPMLDSLYENKQVQFYDVEKRGYVLNTLTKISWTAELKVIESVKQPRSKLILLKTIIIDANKAGVRDIY